jgi:hypothetical protein
MNPKLLDVVMTLRELHHSRLEILNGDRVNLPAGSTGTILYIYDYLTPVMYFIEFLDSQGKELATATLNDSEFSLTQ